jgi:hypothetical protein
MKLTVRDNGAILEAVGQEESRALFEFYVNVPKGEHRRGRHGGEYIQLIVKKIGELESGESMFISRAEYPLKSHPSSVLAYYYPRQLNAKSVHGGWEITKQ